MNILHRQKIPVQCRRQMEAKVHFTVSAKFRQQEGDSCISLQDTPQIFREFAPSSTEFFIEFRPPMSQIWVKNKQGKFKLGCGI